MVTKKKVLAIPEGGIFLKRDVEILKNHFEVRTAPTFNRKKPITTLPSIFKILKGTLWADVTFSWFADTHAFLAVLFSMMLRKKSVVVASGYSVADMPQIKYGSMVGGISSRVVKFTLRHATKVLAVSEFNMREILRYVGSEKVKLIYHSADSSEFKPTGKKQSNLVITTANVIVSNLTRKGLETFVRSARFLPKARFVLIGRFMDESIDYLESIATANVEFTNYVPLNTLIAYYQRAKAYVQVSAHEAFGIALAEAMLCECVPVVTDRGALPEVVGDTGFYVPYGDPEATAEAIGKALNCDEGKEARNRIRKLFPSEKRERELIMEVRELLEA